MGRGAFVANAIVCSALLSLHVAPAHAQQASDAVVAAEALFEAGRSDMASGNFAAACPKFAESQRLDPAVGTLINLADCEEKTKRLSVAWQLWREAAEELTLDDVRRLAVLERRDAIERRVPRLTVKLGRGVPATASIKRNDVEVPLRAVDIALPVDPGEHRLELSAPGYVPTRKNVTLVESARETVVLELGAPLASPSPSVAEPPPAARDDGSTMRILGWSSLAVAVVGIGVGTTTGVMAIGKKKEQEDNCYPIHVCTPAGAEAASSGKTLATASTIAFVAGAAFAGSGAALLWLAPKASKKPSAAAFAPMILRDGAGLSIAGTL